MTYHAKFIAPAELIPVRKTKGSSGYDFVSPERVVIPPRGFIQFDSGVKIDMEEGYFFLLSIRSSLGKRGVSLTNGVAIIDSDYTGTMKAMLINNSDTHVIIEKGERYMQGILIPYALIKEDEVTAERTGGLGSTGK